MIRVLQSRTGTDSKMTPAGPGNPGVFWQNGERAESFCPCPLYWSQRNDFQTLESQMQTLFLYCTHYLVPCLALKLIQRNFRVHRGSCAVGGTVTRGARRTDAFIHPSTEARCWRPPLPELHPQLHPDTTQNPPELHPIAT